MLSEEQVRSFHENGFIRLEQVYPPDELRQMSEELDYVIQNFANWGAAWRGPWREQYMDEEGNRKAGLGAIHQLHPYSPPWTRALPHPQLPHAPAQPLGT